MFVYLIWCLISIMSTFYIIEGDKNKQNTCELVKNVAQIEISAHTTLTIHIQSLLTTIFTLFIYYYIHISKFDIMVNRRYFKSFTCLHPSMKRRHVCFSVTKFNLKHIYHGTMNWQKKCFLCGYSVCDVFFSTTISTIAIFFYLVLLGFLANFRLKTTCRLFGSHRRHFIFSNLLLLQTIAFLILFFYIYFIVPCLVFLSPVLSFSLSIFLVSLYVCVVVPFRYPNLVNSRFTRAVQPNYLRCFHWISKGIFD